MIALKKMTLLRSLLPATMLMGFSDQPERRDLSLSAQKAVWATAIMNTITSATLPSSIIDPSLRDIILNLPDPSSEYDFQVRAKNEVMELFKDGVYLLLPFMVQNRILEARQQDNRPINPQTSSSINQPQSEIQNPSSKTSNQSIKKRKKFIFFPNRIVTAPMFTQLMNYHETAYDQKRNLLITGGFGISKTVSILLFIQLSYHQTRFVYETLGDQEKKEEYDKLIKKGLMPKQVVKYWYWSVQQLPEEKKIIGLLAKQAVELQEDVKEQLQKQTSLAEFITKLRSHYKMQIFAQKVIVDQINTITSLMRKQNKGHPSSESKAAKFCKLFDTVLSLGSYYILNSSITIQIELLRKKQSQDEKLSLQLIGSHSDLENWHFPYEITLESLGGKIEFWQTFWFEYQRRIKQQGLNPTQLQIFKINFFKNIQDISISTFCRFFYARTYLSTHFSRFNESVKSRIRENARNEVILFEAYCLEQSKYFMQKFVKKGEQHKNRIIFKSAYQLASSQISQVNRNKPFIVSMKLMEDIVRRNLKNNNFSLDFFFQGNEHKGIIISWVNNEIRFQWTIRQFVELGKKIFIVQGQKNGWTLLTIQSYTENPSIRGNYIQLYLRECLVENGTMSFRAIDMNKRWIPEYFNIYQTTAFLPVNDLFMKRDEEKLKTYKGVTLQKNFGQAIQTAKDNPGTNILSVPFYFNEKGERIKYCFNSAVIDFLIVSYQQDLKIIHIWSFDVTIAQDPEDKIASVKKLYEFLLKDVTIKDDSVELKHVILCSQYGKIPDIKAKLQGTKKKGKKTEKTTKVDPASQVKPATQVDQDTQEDPAIQDDPVTQVEQSPQVHPAPQADKKKQGVQPVKTKTLPPVFIEYAFLQKLNVTSHSQHNIDQFWHHVRFNESIALEQQKKKQQISQQKKLKKELKKKQKKEQKQRQRTKQISPTQLKKRLQEQYLEKLEAKLMAENEQKMKAKVQVMFAKTEQQAKLAAAELEAKLMAENEQKMKAKVQVMFAKAEQQAKLAAAELEAKLMAENEQKMKAKLQVMFAKTEQQAKLAAAELEAKLMAEYDAKIRAKLEVKQKAEQKVEPKAESKHNQGNQENREKRKK